MRWTLLGLFWAAVAIVGTTVAVLARAGSGAAGFAGFLLLAAWAGGIVSSFAIRSSSRRRQPQVPSEASFAGVPTPRSRRWSARYALGAFVVAFAAASGLALVLPVHVHVGAGVLILDAVLLGTLLPLRRRLGLSRQDLGLRAAPGARSVALVVCGLVAYVAFSALWLLAVLHSHASKSPLSGVKHEGAIDIVLAVIAATVSAPVVEEIFFRGLLYRSLRNRLPVLPATVIAAAVFGAAHITVYHASELPVLAVFGVIACQLYERTGSLLPGIALHSFVDSSGIEVELTGNDVIVIAAFSVLAAALLIRRRHPARGHSRQPRS